MTDEFLDTLGIIIRDQMIMKNSVQVNGLGTFNPVHKNQVQEKNAEGRNVMLPPKDMIEFTAENKS